MPFTIELSIDHVLFAHPVDDPHLSGFFTDLLDLLLMPRAYDSLRPFPLIRFTRRGAILFEYVGTKPIEIKL